MLPRMKHRRKEGSTAGAGWVLHAAGALCMNPAPPDIPLSHASADHLVYCLISPDGRHYAGQTSRIQDRLRQHSRQPPRCMVHDLRLTGQIARFQVEILAAGLTNVDADKTDEHYIRI